MKTWRERIAEAEQPVKFLGLPLWRKGFTDADRAAFMKLETCLIGEALASYGLPIYLFHRIQLKTGAANFNREVIHALYGDDTHSISTMLDRVEDAALELKREAQ